MVQHLPGNDGNGIHEDSIDTLHMIGHSIPKWTIPLILVLTGQDFVLVQLSSLPHKDAMSLRCPFEPLIHSHQLQAINIACWLCFRCLALHR